jgi:exopolysaccharide biosynthesis predicted pyruvyltransferase EpsI
LNLRHNVNQQTPSGLVERLGARLVEDLWPTLAGRKVALIDCPLHPNPGDSAIYLGEIVILRRLKARIVARLDDRTFSVEELKRLGDDVVLVFHGGGNLGDLYPEHDEARLAILQAFPERTIVQMPESILYRDPRNLEAMRRAVAGAPGYTILTRDQQSFEFARSHFDCRVRLAPDAAFALGTRPRTAAPELDVLALSRADVERSRTDLELAVLAEGLTPVDWIEYERPRWMDPAITLNQRSWQHWGSAGPRLAAYERRLGLRQRAVCVHHVDRGMQMLARGRAVVTDRLHAMILAELQGIPVAAYDSGYGKLRSLWSTWMADSPLSTVYDSAEEAVAAATALAEQASSLGQGSAALTTLQT